MISQFLPLGAGFGLRPYLGCHAALSRGGVGCRTLIIASACDTDRIVLNRAHDQSWTEQGIEPEKKGEYSKLSSGACAP
jgi:hypothetical protein